MDANDKKIAIVLASGASKRFGPENKLTMPFGDKSIIEATIGHLEQSNIDAIITVTGHQSDLVRRTLQNHKATFINNPDYSSGLGTSIYAGISSLGKNVGAALIVLGDMPFVDPETINLLLTAHENKKNKLIFIPTYKSKRGNPVLWDKTLFSDLSSLGPKQGGKRIIREKPELIQEISVSDDGILIDIDLPKDIKLFEGK